MKDLLFEDVYEIDLNFTDGKYILSGGETDKGPLTKEEKKYLNNHFHLEIQELGGDLWTDVLVPIFEQVTKEVEK